MRDSKHLRFSDLRHANVQRLPLFKNKQGQPAHSEPDGSDWSLAEWTNAIAGEVGEACNLAKKLMRGDYGEPGTHQFAEGLAELRKELADVVIYSDLACFRAQGDLGAEVVDKFNLVSHRVQADVFLTEGSKQQEDRFSHLRRHADILGSCVNCGKPVVDNGTTLQHLAIVGVWPNSLSPVWCDDSKRKTASLSVQTEEQSVGHYPNY